MHNTPRQGSEPENFRISSKGNLNLKKTLKVRSRLPAWMQYGTSPTEIILALVIVITSLAGMIGAIALLV
ncbi:MULTISPECIES: hypothetical protein [Leptolyngbya]|uniref:hypothetical protein n=1 Tax=Leptolyngbya TaxID=47251 RepID=UPI001688E46A|nr:hypothetical protein [Leptolyngbya sp. FACHB-1624]MBD1855536.1 hypothetical protein [Leptolyngbya sp. FACHB-1624]